MLRQEIAAERDGFLPLFNDSIQNPEVHERTTVELILALLSVKMD